MTHHQFQGFPEWKPENTVSLANNFGLQWPAYVTRAYVAVVSAIKLFYLRLRVWSPLVKIVVHFGGLNPPKFLYQSCFSQRIDLASNVLYGIAMMNFLTTIWLMPLSYLNYILIIIIS